MWSCVVHSEADLARIVPELLCRRCDLAQHARDSDDGRRGRSEAVPRIAASWSIPPCRNPCQLRDKQPQQPQALRARSFASSAGCKQQRRPAKLPHSEQLFVQ
eukprot:TRINITY_DN12117_c0_g1_i25.p3 TRINITY_DN12117_c0_g1~~TRINITY_DN12117_c0_g1_i25.p3  ORF type:complete len:103 (+),score=6.22 TRINITY_DN12117_c0_g1_i25:678-986(+)